MVAQEHIEDELALGTNKSDKKEDKGILGAISSIFKNKDENNKKSYYYEKRDLFNDRSESALNQSALFLFLNRTCFNGLYRVNKSNKFNVPIGSYKTPGICNEENLRLASTLLKDVTILNVDYSELINYADSSSVFYFDPPYKPLNKTSNFNS